jgi:peptidoglycan glycosyltransferase
MPRHLRERYTRRTYAGNRVPRLPAHPGLLRHDRTSRPGLPVLRIALQLVAVLLVLSVIGFIITVGSAYSAYAQVADSLAPRLAALQNREVFETSRIYDRNGTLLYEFFDAGKRTQIGLDEVSPVLINATIAIEDKTFFTNQGVDYEGIARALYQNVSAGEETSGASTITQQVIKNIILTEEERLYENRYQRKMTEIILAQELNERYDKESILELYLNEIYYGNLAYGIEAASDVYFKASADELTLPQAALLAGLPQLPSRYDPLLHASRDDNGAYLPGVRLQRDWLSPAHELPEGTSPPKWRQIAVLRQMVDEGYVTEVQARRAAAADLRFSPQEVPINAPHFVFYVRRLLEERYGQQIVTSGGLNIYTTLDLNIQRMAQRVAREHIESLEERNIHNASVVVMQPNTGQILAMVGSIDYNAIKETTTPDEEGNVLDGQVNVAIRERQPGSALKPFTYLSAMEQGMTPATVLWDVPTEFPTGTGEWYAPENYNKRWNGPVRIRTALANSLNMPAVKALRFAGIENTLELLDRAGVHSGLERGAQYYGLSLTLGGGEVTLLELTTAYNTLASGGQHYPPTSILEITDSEGTVLEAYEPQEPEPAIDPRLVAIISDMLSDDQARQAIWGLNSQLNLSQPAAVKTGTSEDWRDAWTAGYTPFVTVGVWSGNNNNEQTARVESLQGGGIIWRNVMEELFVWIDEQPAYSELFRAPFADGTLPRDFTLPDEGIEERPICSLPGPFGGYNREIFTSDMISNDADAAAGRAICDIYTSVRVVRIPDYARGEGGARYCRPSDSVSYPADQLEYVRMWNLPDPDPDVRVRYTWQGGGAISPYNLRQCQTADFVTPTPAVPPTPAPPVAGAVQMPELFRMGENQAKAELARLGVNDIYVDYQTRARIPDRFDQFAPYVVISTLPRAGNWILPNTTVVLGIRAPDGYGENAAPRNDAAATPTQEVQPQPPEEPVPPSGEPQTGVPVAPTVVPVAPPPAPPDVEKPIVRP